MAKLHELIAIEAELKKTTNEFIKECFVTFSKRTEHFDEHNRTYEAFNEDDKDIPDADFSTMTTTVQDELDFVFPKIGKYFDLILQKEVGNTFAKADIVIEDNENSQVISKDVPVTALVRFENILEHIKNEIIGSIPTLDPKTQWVKGEQRNNVWTEKRPIKKIRTKKLTKAITVTKATDRHAETASLINIDKPVGEYTTVKSSGRFSPLQKSVLLEKVDKLIIAIKRARSRANGQEIKRTKIGMDLFNYLIR